MKVIHVASLVSILLLVFFPQLPAQTVRTDYGTVEFVGLRDWSLAQVRDTLKAISPETELHACSIVLKEELGFPEATVYNFREDDGGMYAVAAVVEPANRDRVRFRQREEFPDWRDTLNAWVPGLESFHQEGLEFQAALRSYPLLQQEGRAAAIKMLNADDAEAVTAVWSFLDSQRAPSVYQQIHRTLQQDENEANRLIATALLVAFPEIDESWYHLLDALRDPEPRVRTMASTVLWSMNRHNIRRIDWAPASRTIAYLLGGTNLNSLYTVMEVLARTEISPDLAADVLPSGGGMVLPFLSARHEGVASKAHALLVQLSGRDYEYDLPQWEQWIASVARSAESKRGDS